MAERFCRCSTPDLAPTPEGVFYCRECGDRVRDKREAIRDATLLEQSRRINALESAAFSNGNGASPHAPDLAAEIADRIRLTPPRRALTIREAAKSLGMGETSFREYVLPYVRTFRRGTLRVIAVAELDRFLEEHSERPLMEQIGER